TTERTFTIPTADFRQSGTLRSGLRTVSVQAKDDGGRLGPIAAATWYVRSPVPDTTKRARLLIVDDVRSRIGGSSNPANGAIDNLFAAAATRNLPAGTFTTLRLDITQPFKSAKGVEQTLAPYDAVLRYRGSLPPRQPGPP